MSDKTKFYADQALMARRWREQMARDAARGDQRPRCQCGLTACEVETLWAVSASRWDPVKFYCSACLPPGTNI